MRTNVDDVINPLVSTLTEILQISVKAHEINFLSSNIDWAQVVLILETKDR